MDVLDNRVPCMHDSLPRPLKLGIMLVAPLNRDHDEGRMDYHTRQQVQDPHASNSEEGQQDTVGPRRDPGRLFHA